MLLTSAPAAGTAGLSALTATARAALRRACACNRGGNRHLRQLTGACVKRVSCAVLQCRTTDNDRLANLDRCHFHHGAAACVGIGGSRSKIDCACRNSGFRTIRYGTRRCCRTTAALSAAVRGRRRIAVATVGRCGRRCTVAAVVAVVCVAAVRCASHGKYHDKHKRKCK